MNKSVVLNCPACSSPLTRILTKSAELDVCLSCKGVWFDQGELLLIVREFLEREPVTPRPLAPFKKLSVLRSETTSKRCCPLCIREMKPYNYSYDSNVILEKCGMCEGIWVDAGEVQQIASYLKENPQTELFANALMQMQKSMQPHRDPEEIARDMRLQLLSFPLRLFFAPRIILPFLDAKSRRFPWVTGGLIALNVLIFLYQVFFLQDPQTYLDLFGFIPTSFWQWSLVSHLFVHAGLFHLSGNMLFLWLFGDNVEERFGRTGFLLFYLVSGVVATMTHAFTHLSSSLPLVGASGAISGIMGAYMVFYPSARIKIFFLYKVIRAPAVAYLAIWLFLQMIYAASTATLGRDGGVAWFAHIGGFLFGGLVAYMQKKQTPADPELTV